MELCCRIAFWMFCLTWYLHANPISPTMAGQSKNPEGFDIDNLGFEFLDDVICEDNMTFASPTHVQENCYTAALMCFMDGLKHAETVCKGDNFRINQTLDALESNLAKTQWPQSTQTTSSKCKWENKGSSKKFTAFVNDTKTFLQLLNSIDKNQ